MGDDKGKLITMRDLNYELEFQSVFTDDEQNEILAGKTISLCITCLQRNYFLNGK